MAVPTSSSNGLPRRNHSARFALLAGLLAISVLPAAVLVAQLSERVTFIQAGAAVPLAAALSVLAIALGRRGRRHAERTLGRIGGGRLARAGVLLGSFGLYLAVTGALTLGVFALLSFLAL